MTHQLDVAGGRDIVARWCILAEQRLQYLTELFETGRWRRFHTELSFLENIQEAKAAVEIWRNLASPAPYGEKSALGMSRVHSSATLPNIEALRQQIGRLPQQPTQIPSEPPTAAISIVPETKNLRSFPAPMMDVAVEMRPKMSSVAERYPLLRNSL
jgi:uncharacterized repeat protein (TIGR03809 family)